MWPAQCLDTLTGGNSWALRLALAILVIKYVLKSLYCSKIDKAYSTNHFLIIQKVSIEFCRVEILITLTVYQGLNMIIVFQLES